MKMAVLARELLRVPFNPVHCFVELAEKPDTAIRLPRIVEITRVALVVLDEIQEFYRLAFHFPARRRSSCLRVIRPAFPLR